MDAATQKRIEVHEAAEREWEAAWDAARDEDARLGRRYDRRIYAEKAAAASRAYLDAHPHEHGDGRECR